MKSYRSHRIVTETEIVDGWLSVDDQGKIAAIEATPSGEPVIEYQDHWLFPGLIDPHLHGLECIKNNGCRTDSSHGRCLVMGRGYRLRAFLYFIRLYAGECQGPASGEKPADTGRGDLGTVYGRSFLQSGI